MIFNFTDLKKSLFKRTLKKLTNYITEPNSSLTDEEFIIKEISSFKSSVKRKTMLDGERYYEGKHDILTRQRTVIGKDGELEVVKNLPNNRIVDNQYKKMVVQKSNYLFGKPLTIQCDNAEYAKILKQFINKKFMSTLKAVSEDALNCGIGYLFPMYDNFGNFVFRRFRPWEIIPYWKDNEHTELEYFIRIYNSIGKDGKTLEKAEIYDEKGISYFELQSGTLFDMNGKRLKLTGAEHIPYFSVDGNGYNWTKIPLIPFKYNSKEIPLIKMVKSLQDGLNLIESNFQNQMEEDPRNTILVVVNYDGENLGEFRKNLSTYGAVKVRTIDGKGGDLKTLQVEVNAENYKSIIALFKKAIIENAMGYDAKDDRLNGNPNEMNIQSMYSDIDLDANGMETEFQASFDEVKWFIDMHLYNIGLGDFEDEKVEIILNRDMMINESEIIKNINNSVGILSDETLIAQHPWVNDVQTELSRLKAQNNEEQYAFAFNQNVDKGSGDS